jgi:hypothetical protein
MCRSSDTTSPTSYTLTQRVGFVGSLGHVVSESSLRVARRVCDRHAHARHDRGCVWAGHGPVAQQRVSPCKRVANTSGPVGGCRSSPRAPSPAGCCRRFHAGWQDAAEPGVALVVGQRGHRTGDVHQMPFGVRPHGHDGPGWRGSSVLAFWLVTRIPRVRDIGISYGAQGHRQRIAVEL